MALGPMVRVHWVELETTIHGWACQILAMVPSDVEEIVVRNACGLGTTGGEVGHWLIFRDSGAPFDHVDNDAFQSDYTIDIYDPNA